MRISSGREGRRQWGFTWWSLIVLLVLLLSTLPLCSSWAEEDTKVVRVGYYEDNDGFQAGFSDDAPKSGYAYEFYQELAKHTGWTYTYVYGSWSDIYQKLVKGDVDIMGGVSKLPERQPYMLFPDTPMGVESYYIFVPSSNKTVRSDDLATLKGLRIGVNDNTYMLDLLKLFVAENHLDSRSFPSWARLSGWPH